MVSWVANEALAHGLWFLPRVSMCTEYNLLIGQADSRDPDGDSEMASSVGSNHSDSDIAEQGTRTPTRVPHSSAAVAELSPPGSQPQQTSNMPRSDLKEHETIQQSTRASEGAGAWKSKRAEAETHRAWEHVVDRDFNLGTSSLLSFSLL